MALAEKRKKRERAHLLSILVTASRGDRDDIKAMFNKLNVD
jgi:hypothetical protein